MTPSPTPPPVPPPVPHADGVVGRSGSAGGRAAERRELRVEELTLAAGMRLLAPELSGACARVDEYAIIYRRIT